MPREIVTVQVGQCGNQLGQRWFDVMLQEHKTYSQFPEARDAVFLEDATTPGRLKARCVAVDMEQGVLHAMLRGPLRDIFDSNFFVSDVSGAGNNWAVGHMEYGDRYVDAIAESVRRQVEQCDCIQSFFVAHSLSGGTGSGLGTRVLGMLEDEFPHVFRICPVVMPSEVDDVVTAPYNSCFALKELVEHADCVLPLDNDALARMADRALSGGRRGAAGVPAPHAFSAAHPTETKGLPYDSMNGLVAQLLSNLTCAMRFPGPLNMDMNEITTNLVPYPRLHLLTAAMAPLSVSSRHAAVGPRSVDAMITACLEPEHQFVDVRRDHGSAVTREAGKTLATALIARGPQVTVGDLARGVGRLRGQLEMPYWNEDGFKTALCGVSPLGHKDSMLLLANNCAIRGKVEAMLCKFERLYAVRSHVHHYEQYLSPDYFRHTSETLRTLVDDYAYLDTARPPADVPRSMKDLIYC
ncbi:epsilon tubulin [Novymonas esmeraldas]|uniref:Epsilon tubulin n=1 Tax=Novymonas esmeraldas TaxID=1808958 RepID=A0AAW0EL70_9TRYP